MQYDTEWFFMLDDMSFYLKEDLSEVEFVYLPIEIDGEKKFVKCASFEDILEVEKNCKVNSSLKINKANSTNWLYLFIIICEFAVIF